MRIIELIDIFKSNNEGLTAIVEPTKYCNLDCRYCYIDKSKSKEIMSDEMLVKVIKNVIEYNGNQRTSKFIWHGGEPLLAGIGFFERIIEIQTDFSRHNFKIKNSIQTNLTLLNDEYIDFFRNNHFHIGSSLDGNKSVHDYYRGQGTFKKVLKNYFIAKEKGLNIGIICVLNKRNKNLIKEMYSFYKDNNIAVSFTPMFPSDNDFSEVLNQDEYYEVLKELFDLWYWDDNLEVRINPCDGIVQGILLKGITSSCAYSKNCMNHFVSIVPNGDVYPCNRFVDRLEFRLGNLSEMTFEDMMSSKIRINLLKRNARSIEQCKECKYIDYCNGGCMNNAYLFYNDVYAPDFFCKSFYKVFEYARNLVTNSLIN